MPSVLDARLHFARAVVIAALAAQLFPGSSLAGASEPPRPAEPSERELTQARRALREFDRFLDHHPLLEDELRINSALVGEESYLRANCELRDFLAANPEARVGLRLYPRYFLYRALLRQARVPLRFADVAQLKMVLDQQPDVERALSANPELIGSETFLKDHAALRDFLRQSPVLEQVFLPHEKVPAEKN